MSLKKRHALRGPLLKIERARKHIREFKRAHDAFTAKHTWIWADRDPKTGDRLVRYGQKRRVPARWSVIVGDALFNLRATLDHLACQLVIAGSSESQISRDTGFPIFDKPKEVTATTPQVKGMASEAIARINRLRPYNGANRPLWVLHKLNIIDKHRLLLLMVPTHQGTALHGEDVGPLFGPDVYLAPINRPRLLRHGDEIERHPARRRRRHSARDKAIKISFHLAVALADTRDAGVDGFPVLQMLTELTDYVEWLVSSFEDLLTCR